MRLEPAARPGRRRRLRDFRGSGGCRAWRGLWRTRASGATRRARVRSPCNRTRRRTDAGSAQRLRRGRRWPQDAVPEERGRCGAPQSAGRAQAGAGESEDSDQKATLRGASTTRPTDARRPRRADRARASSGAQFAPPRHYVGDRFPPAGGRPLRGRDRRAARKRGAQQRFRVADHRRAAQDAGRAAQALSQGGRASG